MEEQKKPVEFRMIPHGPLRATGKLTVIDGSGKMVEMDGDIDFCRCGLSTTKPFCDGRHCRQ